MSEICVVHLVRAKNGKEPFKRFLESYANNRGGIEHDLLVIFKGFYWENDLAEYLKLLTDIPHRQLFVHDFGFDIRGYFKAAKTFHYRFFCFLNSYSILLDKDWLLKMYRYASREDAGLVGATGSCESIYSDRLQGYVRSASFYKRFRGNLRLKKFKSYFDPFPNYHIRTNGFMIKREQLLKIRGRKFWRKRDMHRFESGKNSLTKQILKLDLKVFVVGKDNRGYEKEDWHKSNTFRQGDQSNLLIADNQTTLFDHSDLRTKLTLSRSAWGDKACVTN
jgi:hypothetical protein